MFLYLCGTKVGERNRCHNGADGRRHHCDINGVVCACGVSAGADGDRARSVFVLFYVYAYALFGEQLLYQLGPFKEAVCVALEVLFVAHVIDFFD